MKIILVNYPYGEYEIGTVVDFGEAKNKSLVEMQRAVWAKNEGESPQKVIKDTVKKLTTLNKKSSRSKKFLNNELGQKIDEKKKEGKNENNSFWDKLK